MSTRLTILAALAPVVVASGFGVFGAFASDRGGAGNPDGAGCEVRVVRDGPRISIDGIVRSDEPLTGSYSFVVERSGRGGGFDINQGGEFAVRAGGEVLVANVTVGDGGSFHARLTVSSERGREVCTSDQDEPRAI